MTSTTGRCRPPKCIATLDCWLVAGEGELLRKIANSGAVGWNIRIASLLGWVRQVVAAARRDRRQAPVLFDELDERDMVTVLMRHMTALRVLGDDDERNAGTIAEEVDRLNITRVIVPTALIPGYEDGSVGPEGRVGLDLVDDLLHEALVE